MLKKRAYKLLEMPYRAFHRGSDGEKDYYGLALKTVRYIYENNIPNCVNLGTGAGHFSIGFATAENSHTDNKRNY